MDADRPTSPRPGDGDGDGDVSIAAYQAHAQQYIDSSERPGPVVLAYLDQLAALVPGGLVLEIGSGPGWDAAHLESRGVRVVRTDATPAFVQMLRADGHDARVLDARTSALSGPYDAVLADAVLHHLARDELADFLVRARGAVRDGGIVALTLKEGDGSAWTRAKIDTARHFTYWRVPALRGVLQASGWNVVRCETVAGRSEPWIVALARS